MAIKDYSTTAGSNTSVAGINIAEGCPAANVNNGMRAMMADIRSFYEGATWTDLGHTPTRTGNTTFTINSDVTAYYISGRRIRCTDSSTLYGTIASSSYSAPNTTVTVTLDSGNLSASLTAVAVSVIDPTGDPIPATALSGQVASANIDTTVTGFLVPTGAVIPYAGASAPTGWLLCYGQAVSRTTYAALFSAISTTYGVGDGSTTFNLPDLRGRAVFGQDDMGGSSADRITVAGSGMDGDVLGTTGGSEFLHQHTHTATVTDLGHTHQIGTSGVGGTGFAAGTSSANTSQYNTLSATTGVTVSNANAGTGSSQNIPPAIILNYIIKE